MSLVPSRQHIIRRVNETSVVVFNPVGNQLAVVNQDSPRKRRRHSHPKNFCGHCGQRIYDDELRHDYFLILDQFNKATPSTTRASTPTPSEFSNDEISSLSFSQGYFERFFKSLGLLGRGSRAAVYHVEHLLEGISIGQYALKKIPVGFNSVWLRKVLTEVNFLRQLSHPNLVRYNHVWLEVTSLSDFGPPVPCAYLLQEYCNGGTLEDYCETHGELSLETIKAFMGDIGAGIEHLHSQGLVHCDLKPSNCLLKIEGGRPLVLVSDFGECQIEGVRRAGTGSTGTLEYCAPEVLVTEGVYPPFTRASDMFSVGMSMYYLSFGKLPYSDLWAQEQNVDLLLQEVRGYRFAIDEKKVREELLELLPLLKRLLDSPLERPSASEFCLQLAQGMAPKALAQEPPPKRPRRWKGVVDPNYLRLAKLLSAYFLGGAALHLCVALAVIELGAGRMSEELFIGHFLVLLFSIFIK